MTTDERNEWWQRASSTFQAEGRFEDSGYLVRKVSRPGTPYVEAVYEGEVLLSLPLRYFTSVLDLVLIHLQNQPMPM
jgi:hypothetical protein